MSPHGKAPPQAARLPGYSIRWFVLRPLWRTLSRWPADGGWAPAREAPARRRDTDGL